MPVYILLLDSYRFVLWLVFSRTQSFCLFFYTPTRREGAILQSPCPSVRSQFRLKMSQLLLEEMILFLIHDFGIVACTVSPFSRLTAHLIPVYRATFFHVCRNENFRYRYLGFYWKKWFYIWYVALAWWLVLCLPFPGLLHIYFLFTECWDIYKFDTNERVGVFLARRSVQHLVYTMIGTENYNI